MSVFTIITNTGIVVIEVAPSLAGCGNTDDSKSADESVETLC
ncbi:hypothetical protein R69776_08005 [Paraburkholderia nemoris]|uniref:Uncharacterized protein n=1 Tax=Paraburkholderia nemoris TaxID=2793076 RepID=A0ABM8T617_9BURK|nr:hypothetical protein R69776_08005 [Paraburkholderia nemoris]